MTGTPMMFVLNIIDTDSPFYWLPIYSSEVLHVNSSVSFPIEFFHFEPSMISHLAILGIFHYEPIGSC